MELIIGHHQVLGVPGHVDHLEGDPTVTREVQSTAGCFKVNLLNSLKLDELKCFQQNFLTEQLCEAKRRLSVNLCFNSDATEKDEILCVVTFTLLIPKGHDVSF